MSPEAAPRLRLLPGGVAPAGAAADSGAEDEKLVARARHHDLLAFEVLYRRHAGFALNLAVRIQGTAHDAEDIVHDCYVRLLKKAAAYNLPADGR